MWEDFLTTHIESSKIFAACYNEYDIFIKSNCKKTPDNQHCKLLSKIYNDCIKFQNQKIRSEK